MTTKPFLQQPIAPPVSPRIVIDIDPVSGKSTLKTRGVVTMPLVIDTLMAQLTALWAQFIKDMSKNVVTANGTPAGTPQIMDEGPYNDGN